METSKPKLNGSTKAQLLESYLNQQQNLSAVEEFSLFHKNQQGEESTKYYQKLIPTDKPKAGEQYSFQVDLDKCSGCKSCVTGCNSRNGLDEGENWRSVGMLQGNSPSQLLKKEIPFQQHITSSCHHCLDPACLTGCPVKAYEKDPFTGIVKHLDDQCIGCQYCILKCPYGAPQYNKEKGIVRKCDMCTSRLNVGKAPACVQSCPTEAIRITVIKTDTVKQNPEAIFDIPHAHTAEYSLPTTSYIGKKKLTPEAVTAPQQLKNQNPEWPLVFMLVLTQASVGTLATQLFNNNLNSTASLLAILLSLGFGLLGLAIAPLHLGRPLLAFRVFLGLRTSWLSREAVIFGVYILPLSTLSALLGIKWMEIQLNFLSFITPNSLSLLLYTSLLLGVAGVYSSAMIYKDTPRAWWASSQTIFKFFLTSVLLGSALHLFSLSVTSTPIPLISWISLILFTITKLILEASLFFSPKTSVIYDSAKLIMQDKTLNRMRWITGVLGGMILPLIAVLLPDKNLTLLFTSILFLSLLMGELLERVFFFKASVPPHMPGCYDHK